MAMFECNVNSNLGHSLGLKGKKIRLYRSKYYWVGSDARYTYYLYIDDVLVSQIELSGMTGNHTFEMYRTGNYDNGYAFVYSAQAYTYDGEYKTIPTLQINGFTVYNHGAYINQHTPLDVTFTLN